MLLRQQVRRLGRGGAGNDTRERFHACLQESKQGKFGSFFYIQMEPAVAERALQALVKVAALRSGVAPVLEHLEDDDLAGVLMFSSRAVSA